MADAEQTSPEISDEEAAIMQQQLMRYHAQQAAQTAREREQKLGPLIAVIDGAGYADLFDKLQTLHLSGAYLAMTNVDANLRSLITIMPLLKDAVARA